MFFSDAYGPRGENLLWKTDEISPNSARSLPPESCKLFYFNRTPFSCLIFEGVLDGKTFAIFVGCIQESHNSVRLNV